MFENSFHCFGHRGARGHEPENTLLSIEKGIQLGADSIEIDVYVVDGQIMVIHDDKLNRTTNGRGSVYSKTFEELRKLDAGKGEKIPTLNEVMVAVKGRASLNIEIKGTKSAEKVVKCIEEWIEKGFKYSDILVSSFNLEELRTIRVLNENILIGACFMKISPETIEQTRKMGCFSVHVSKSKMTGEFVDKAHQKGLKVFVFTVNSIRDIRKMKKLEVDGVFTDFPERVKQASQ